MLILLNYDTHILHTKICYFDKKIYISSDGLDLVSFPTVIINLDANKKMIHSNFLVRFSKFHLLEKFFPCVPTSYIQKFKSLI